MVLTSDLSIQRRNGTTLRGHLALPEGGGPRPGVVVIHELMGLNADIRRITQRFAADGYAALAPDLYDQSAPRPICIARLMVSLNLGKGAAFDDIAAARAHLAAHPRVDGSRIGITGFCIGGGFALLAAVGGDYAVSAPYYGEVPKKVERLAGICPVVAGYGGKDRVFGPHAERLRHHLTTLGVPHDIETYPEAGHSYMSHHPETLLIRLAARGPMKVGFSESASEDSWKRMLAFFEKHL